MQKRLCIDGVERRVTVDRSAGYFVVMVDDRRYEICDALINDGVLNFFIGRKVYRAVVSRNSLGMQMTLNGRDYVMEDRGDDEETAGASHHHGDGSVKAPMPGAVTSVHVAVGETVRGGQSLLVLESMKMQNEVTSPLDGEVHAVSCKIGDQVSFGQVLVEIAASKE